MRRLLVAPCLFCVLVAGAAEPEKVNLQVGDAAPAFESIDDNGMPWKSADHVGKKFIVVYFYPGDFTPGCTRQAQSFRDRINELYDQGAEVVGVSGDSFTTHSLFKQAICLNCTLLADEDGGVAKRFGVPVGAGGEVRVKDADGRMTLFKRAVTTARWTFIIGRDGKIAYKNTKVNPIDDAKQVAAILEKLSKE